MDKKEIIKALELLDLANERISYWKQYKKEAIESLEEVSTIELAAIKKEIAEEYE